MQFTLACIDGQMRFDAPERTVRLHMAEREGRVYIDLCDPQSHAIE
jgi:hypothetical protein